MQRVLSPDIDKLEIEISNYVLAMKANALLPARPIIEKILFIKIITKDIATLVTLIENEIGEPQRNVLSRSLALLLYEFYQDVNNLYNKKFEQTYVKALSPQMVTALQAIKKMTAMFYTQYFKKLKLIRMNVVGHRDFDTVKQYDIIKEIDSDEIAKMGKATLFITYWFGVFHIIYAAQSYIVHKMPVPKPFLKFKKRDLDLWAEAVKYMAAKNANKTNS
jgi:hypothetical protein